MADLEVDYLVARLAWMHCLTLLAKTSTYRSRREFCDRQGYCEVQDPVLADNGCCLGSFSCLLLNELVKQQSIAWIVGLSSAPPDILGSYSYSLVHCKFGSLLHRALAEQNDGNRLEKDLKVQREREVVDVVQVELHPGVKISDATTSVDLP
jgi:hypothetical protein